MIRDILSAAYALVDAGFQIFPLRDFDDVKPIKGEKPGEEFKRPKKPRLNESWKELATSDKGQIEIWCRKFPKMNIGITTGSGLFVIDLDVDPEKGLNGIEELPMLEARLGQLPKTWRVRTPRGGLHIYLRTEPGWQGSKNTESKLAQGIDTRGEGGYVVGPGSSVQEVGEYTWLPNTGPRSGQSMPHLPDEWRVFLEGPKGSPKASSAPRVSFMGDGPRSNNWAQAALESELEELRTAPEGTRNARLNKSSFALGQIVGGGSLEPGETRALLMSTALEIGLSEQESERTVRSGFESGMLEPRRPPERYISTMTHSNPENQSSTSISEDDLKIVPALGDIYNYTHFEADKNSELVSLARLPGWAEAPPPSGHGWGGALEKLIGGGLEPGEMVGIGASSAGAGKTAFIHQIADGLALRSAAIADDQSGWGNVLTPVLFLSEMNVRTLSRRSLARWLGTPHGIFRQYTNDNEDEWSAAIEALKSGNFSKARQWIRVLPMDCVSLIEKATSTIRHLTELKYPGKTVVPVVIVDPVQRGASMTTGEIEAMNEWSDRLRRMTTNEKTLTFVTSDTNKESARGQTHTKQDDWELIEEGVSAFRGTYRLQHDFDVAIYLKTSRGSGEEIDANGRHYRETTVTVVKTRNGFSTPPWPKFRWYGSLMRFEPCNGKKDIL